MGSSNSYGLDTSVVVRLLTRHPPEQAALALQRVQAEAPCLISDLVVTEAYFALQAHYGVSKPEALAALLRLLESPLIEPTGEAPRALQATLAAASQKPGFADRLIHMQYAPDRLLTFEKASRRLTGAEILSL